MTQPQQRILDMYTRHPIPAGHILAKTRGGAGQETSRAGMPAGDEDFYQAYGLLVDSVQAGVLGGARFTAVRN
jgi:hypothetical protein